MANKPRLLFLIGSLGRGGAEKQLTLLLQEMQCTRFNIAVVNFSVSDQDHWEAAVLATGVEYYRVGKHAGKLRRYIEVFRILRELSPDLVWAWTPPFALYVLPFRWLLSYRVVAGIRNDTEYTIGDFWGAKFVLKVSDAVVANTQAAVDSLPDYGIEAKRKFVLPNVIEYQEAVEIADHVRRIGTCGNIHPRKDLGTFLEAVSVLVANGSDVEYIVAGHGDLEPYVSLARELGIAGIVRFVQDVECAELIRTFDIFVLPSKHEGCPNTLLEAQMQMIPCVATMVGGVPEVIEPGVNGLTFQVGDSVALAEQITRLIEDLELRKRLAEDGRRRVLDGRCASTIINEHFSPVIQALVSH